MQPNHNDKPVLAALRDLDTDQSVVFPISRLSYVQVACARFGLQWSKKFKTSVDRHAATITVTRIS